MSLKKIVFVDQCLGGGGAERILCTILRYLNSDEFEVHLVIISNLGVFASLIPDNVIVHELCVSRTSKSLFKFLKIIKKINPVIVYSSLHRITALLVVAKIIGRDKYSIVARLPSLPSKEVSENNMSGWRLFLYRICYRFVTVVIAQTNEMALDLRKVFKVNEDCILVINNPIDSAFIDEKSNFPVNSFTDSFINVVACGSLKKAKGYEFLLESFSIVVLENKKFRLFILGEDVEDILPDLKSIVKKYNLDEFVVFTGHVDNPYAYLAHCDLYVLSSRWEGYPNSLVDAIYCGAPVIATKCNLSVEKIIDDNGGVLVEFGSHKNMANAILSFSSIKMNPLKMNNSIIEFENLFKRL